MNDTLKVAGRIGAELGAAKAEVDKLRAILEGILFCGRGTSGRIILEAEDEDRIRGALMQASPCQAQNGPCPGDGVSECKDCPTAVDMATAAAQGFRDGQAAVEQAPAQDERELCPSCHGSGSSGGRMHCNAAGDSEYEAFRCESCDGFGTHLARPAQTEQQPAVPAGFVLLPLEPTEAILDALHSGGYVGDDKELRELYQSLLDAAPIAQTAPQGKFRMGDLVKKSTGSEWEGRVVGWYSTEQTPEGYAVESEAHAGSVQIYPAKALEAV